MSRTPYVKVLHVPVPYSVYEYLEHRLGDYESVVEYLQYVANREFTVLAIDGDNENE